MKKTELIKELAKRTYSDGQVKLSQNTVRELLDAFTEVVAEGLKTDGEVLMTGFGRFKATDKPSRVGHNPKDPTQSITIPARTQISFSSGENLKAAVNNK